MFCGLEHVRFLQSSSKNNGIPSEAYWQSFSQKTYCRTYYAKTYYAKIRQNNMEGNKNIFDHRFHIPDIHYWSNQRTHLNTIDLMQKSTGSNSCGVQSGLRIWCTAGESNIFSLYYFHPKILPKRQFAPRVSVSINMLFQEQIYAFCLNVCKILSSAFQFCEETGHFVCKQSLQLKVKAKHKVSEEWGLLLASYFCGMATGLRWGEIKKIEVFCHSAI